MKNNFKKILSFSIILGITSGILPFKNAIAEENQNTFIEKYFGLTGVSKFIEIGNEKVVRLTEEVYGYEVGGMYLKEKINLKNDFSFRGKFGLGSNKRNPGDGIAFIFHPGDFNEMGLQGGGLGVIGVKNSLGFVVDTLSNCSGTYREECGKAPYGQFWGTGDDVILTNRSATIGDIEKYVKRYGEAVSLLNGKTMEEFFNGDLRDIDFKYFAGTKNLQIKITDKEGQVLTWEKDISDYIEEISQKYNGNSEVTFAINAGKAISYSAHDVYFYDIKYNNENYIEEVEFLDFGRDRIETEELFRGETEILDGKRGRIEKNILVRTFPDGTEQRQIISEKRIESINEITKIGTKENNSTKVKVNDINNLSNEEKTEVKEKIKRENPNLNLNDNQIFVGNDGSVRITFEGKVRNIGNILTVVEKTKSEKTEITKPGNEEKIKVESRNSLSEEEKEEIKNLIKSKNEFLEKEQIKILENGNIEISFLDNSKIILNGKDFFVEKYFGSVPNPEDFIIKNDSRVTLLNYSNEEKNSENKIEEKIELNSAPEKQEKTEEIEEKNISEKIENKKEEIKYLDEFYFDREVPMEINGSEFEKKSEKSEVKMNNVKISKLPKTGSLEIFLIIFSLIVTFGIFRKRKKI